MSLPQEIQESGRVFEESLASLEQYSATTKELKKKAARAKRHIKKYMTQNNMTTLKIGERVFSFEQAEKIVCTMDRVEKSFPSTAVEKYKKENTEIKTVFSCD